MIILKIIHVIIQLLCLPIKFIVNLVYGTNDNNIIAYSWYTPKEYNILLKVAEQESDNLMYPSHQIWLKNARKTIKKFNSYGMIVICIDIKINDLEQWLYINNLPNHHESREKYLYKLFYQELDKGLRVSGKKLTAGTHRSTPAS